MANKKFNIDILIDNCVSEKFGEFTVITSAEDQLNGKPVVLATVQNDEQKKNFENLLAALSEKKTIAMVCSNKAWKNFNEIVRHSGEEIVNIFNANKTRLLHASFKVGQHDAKIEAIKNVSNIGEIIAA